MVEDDLITDAIMVTKPCTGGQCFSVPELHSGYTKKDARLVLLSLTDKENQHCIQRIHEVIGRCLPCRKAGCSHGWKTCEFADGSGFYAMRTCAANDQIKWTSPGMLDHHEASVNAYIAADLPYFLCLFHKEKAILDYLSGTLLVTGVFDSFSRFI